jgi:hypothetical protein
MKYWTKIDKLVVYKHRSQLEAKRREAMDRHLSFLVGQTEKYSAALMTAIQSSVRSRCRASVVYVSDHVLALLTPVWLSSLLMRLRWSRARTSRSFSLSSRTPRVGLQLELWLATALSLLQWRVVVTSPVAPLTIRT